MKKNLILAVGILIFGALYYFLNSQENPSPSQTEKSKTETRAPSKESQPLFKIEDVSSVTWTAGPQSLVAVQDKASGWKIKSIKGSKIDFDPWQLVRRLEILSHSEPLDLKNSDQERSAKDQIIETKIHIQFHDGKTWDGEANEKEFRWTSRGIENKGISFEQNPDVKNTFDEGLLGLSSHDFALCAPKEVKAFAIEGSWSVEKQGKLWRTQFKSQNEPGREYKINNFLSSLCHFKIDFFKTQSPSSPKRLAATLKAKSTTTISKSGDVFSTGDLSFTSSQLEGLLKVEWSEVKDASAEQGRTAMNAGLTVKERVAAIRKMKELGSEEALPALKEILFENTDVDIFRYEAVDALAAIGTKEAFALIAKRLSEVERSGFQLRLARALSGAMGRAFTSDEKSPPSSRDEEVRDLLAAYKKDPPGK